MEFPMPVASIPSTSGLAACPLRFSFARAAQAPARTTGSAQHACVNWAQPPAHPALGFGWGLLVVR
jgi:hypothetical protein